MKKYGNILIARRVALSLLLCICTFAVLIPSQIVKADSGAKRIYRVTQAQDSSYQDKYNNDSIKDNAYTDFPADVKMIFVRASWKQSPYPDYVGNYVIFLYKGKKSGKVIYSGERSLKVGSDTFYASFDEKSANYTYSAYKNGTWDMMYRDSDMNIIYPTSYYESVNQYSSADSLVDDFLNKYANGEIGDNVGFQAKEKAYSEIGCLDNVQMETYITNKKELDYADENADLSKINQDKVIVYSSTSTTGIDLSKGGYKVQLYGSYAWQDKSGNIKSEDKGHKTFIKDWDARDNIKGLDRSKYKWIDWKSANDKVEADKTDKAHKPTAFEKMTTYANYQYEPIWYLRIVSQDNKYGAWVKLYNSSTKKGNYDSDSVDDDDNKVDDSNGGYDKTKSTSEITGTGDTPEDAKNNVQKAEEKQDNEDLNDSSNGNNSTFDKLEQFTKGIGDVPKMIADIFSFLPSWCLEVVAIGFALLMILIVVKFIRG